MANRRDGRDHRSDGGFRPDLSDVTSYPVGAKRESEPREQPAYRKEKNRALVHALRFEGVFEVTDHPVEVHVQAAGSDYVMWDKATTHPIPLRHPVYATTDGTG